MDKSPCCEKERLKKGPWTPEEDHKLLAFIEQYGHGSWRALPAKAGLQRCGKSCRLRWANYLRPDIKRGKFSLQEEQTIIQLHALIGNRWSIIATHLPKRTDNEIKNHWNTHLKKRLNKMGIDPVTHKRKIPTLDPDQLKDIANLSHKAQWESTRLEAEARLTQKSKLQVFNTFQKQLGSSNSARLVCETMTTPTALLPPPPLQPLCLDVLTAWQGSWPEAPKCTAFLATSAVSLDSIPSTLSFSEKGEAMGLSSNFPDELERLQLLGLANSTDDDSLATGNENILLPDFIEAAGLADMLLLDSSDPSYPSITGENYSNNLSGTCCGVFEENKNCWYINMLNLVNWSPSDSPVF